MRSSRLAPEADPLLTLTQIARHFSLPESTARYYCKRFSPYIPCTGEGRRRRYRQEALAVIAAILEHMRTERTASGVEEALCRLFPRQMDALVPMAATHGAPALDTLPTTAPTGSAFVPVMAMKLLEQQTKAMEGIAASLDLLARRQDDLQQLSEQARQVSEENVRLRQELENIRLLQHTSEKMQQEDLNQIRTWVARMTRRNESPTL